MLVFYQFLFRTCIHVLPSTLYSLLDCSVEWFLASCLIDSSVSRSGGCLKWRVCRWLTTSCAVFTTRSSNPTAPLSTTSPGRLAEVRVFTYTGNLKNVPLKFLPPFKNVFDRQSWPVSVEKIIRKRNIENNHACEPKFKLLFMIIYKIQASLSFYKDSFA